MIHKQNKINKYLFIKHKNMTISDNKLTEKKIINRLSKKNQKNKEKNK